MTAQYPTSEYTNTAGFVHKWKKDDSLAQKSGLRKTILTIKGNSYTGEWFENKKEGEGHQIWSETGKEYKGTWKNDMRHGLGTLWEPINPPTKSKKTTKTGYGSSKKGIASVLQSRSSTRSQAPQVLGIVDPEQNESLRLSYEGAWLWDKMHGTGRRLYRNGDIYEGEWQNGTRHGFGLMNYANGDVYEGEWAEGLRHGKGVLFLQDGNRYEGMWSKGKKDGKGSFYYTSKKQKMDGEWLEDICKCGTLAEYAEELPTKERRKKREEGDTSSNGSLSSSSSSSDISTPTSPAPPLPSLYLINPDQVLQEQGELVQKLRDMKVRGTTARDEDDEEDEDEAAGEDGEVEYAEEGDGQDVL